MLRAFAIASLAGAAAAHRYCSELGADGLVKPECADPDWVKKFSYAVDGPDQIWINYGRTIDAMVAGWVTSNMTAGSIVQWGPSSGNYPNSATGNATFYKYSAAYTSGLIHHATMTGLQPGTTYYYRVGDSSAWSSEYSFKSNPLPSTYPYTIGFVADVGEGSAPAETVAHLVTRLPNIDALSINGDISYASGCEATGCTNWDAFQRMMMPVSSVRPFSVNIGNHETYDVAQGTIAISARTRFSGMPYPVGSPDDIWYFSYNAGPAHIISLSSFYTGGFGASSPLIQFLNADLAKVDRTVTPWLLVVIHAPWYNSNSAHQGDGEVMRQAVEPILLAAKVNAVLTGHVHSYERTYPVANNKVVPEDQGIVHMNVGDGGASLYTTWINPQPAWSAARQATWGHGELQILNATTAIWTWHRNQDNEPKIDDSYTLTNSVGVGAAPVRATPAVEQIHIAYTGKLGELSVDFVSTDADGQVAWSLDNKTFTSANTTSFSYAGIGNLHQGLMAPLPTTPGTPVYYKVGGGASGFWSETFEVTAVPARYPTEKYAVFGDFGMTNDICMSDLIDSAKSGVYDAVLHVGDWAYNMEDGASSTGNTFMNLIQGYAAIKPTMPAAGNHEACGLCLGVPGLEHSNNNFTQYRSRLHSVTLYAGANAGTNSNIYYSFNQGITHFLVFSAEAYAYKSGPELIAAQLAFMKADLAAVDRSVTPWVVGLVHKDFTMQADAYADFSPVLESGGVDLLFVGHVHQYNRYVPYDPVSKQTDKGSVSADGSTYTNPSYMTTIITGASGDREGETGCPTPAPEFSFLCSTNYGWGVFQALNSTHATWDFHTVKADGSGPSDFTDHLTIIQNNHGPRSVV